MKKIAVVYRNRKNPAVIAWLSDRLKQVYEDYVVIENYYMEEMGGSERIEADVLLLISRDLLPKLRHHTASFKNVVVMTRSIERTYLKRIIHIPTDTDVLVVNDTLSSAQEMVLMFYELGIGHLNLIPFDLAQEPTGIYRDIQYAITPNEPQLVPVYIPTVINTGYRAIGFDTMVHIANTLKLAGRVTYNLVRYISTITEPMQDYRASYFSSFLKERLLNEYVYDSSDAIFAVDANEKIIYCNLRARELFSFDADMTDIPVKTYLPGNLMQLIASKKELLHHPVAFGGMDFLLDKTTIAVGDEELGYSITLRDEILLKDMETSFNKKLREKGFYAKHVFSDLQHTSAIMTKSIEMAQQAALTDYTILIGGETGTGKELLAQAIHNGSPRKNMPFIAVNCAAISETLLESELFGYEEGAFTGARKHGKLGYFEQANRGTIFLDEIGDISPRLQLGLLRVLQEKQIMKIGSDRIVDVDVRIIAATNKDLWQEVGKGSFRQDLYFRISAITISLPPLRKRREDLPILFHTFMGKNYNKISPKSREALLRYGWPGNVRELENCALYYRTLGELPPQICARDASAGDGADPEKLVLQIIAAGEGIGHGVGRPAMLRLLQERGTPISDAALRKVLRRLQDGGLVTIGSGRQGTQLTARGRQSFDGAAPE